MENENFQQTGNVPVETATVKDVYLFPGTSRGSRFIAAIIDNFIAIFLSIILSYLITSIFTSEFSVFFIIIICFIYLFYYFLMEAVWSRTLGKMITGLVISNQNGGKINTMQAIIRTLSRIIEVNPFFLLPAGLFIVFTKRKQRLGDLLAGTVVNFKYD